MAEGKKKKATRGLQKKVFVQVPLDGGDYYAAYAPIKGNRVVLY